MYYYKNMKILAKFLKENGAEETGLNLKMVTQALFNFQMGTKLLDRAFNQMKDVV